MTPSDDLDQKRASVGDLLAEISSDVTTLMRQEVALAKAEVRESATQAGAGVGLIGGAGVAGNLALVFLSVAAWWALGESIGRSWSAVVVPVFWAIVAVVMALAGRARLRSMRGLPRTSETISRIPRAMKGEETS